MRYAPDTNRLEKLQQRAAKRVELKKRQAKAAAERKARFDKAESDRLSAKKNAYVRMPKPKEFADKWYARFGEWPKNYNPSLERYLVKGEDGYV
jgi:murein DD-endopeptidase MepM/ murein hydrolase activator NlpD